MLNFLPNIYFAYYASFLSMSLDKLQILKWSCSSGVQVWLVTLVQFGPAGRCAIHHLMTLRAETYEVSPETDDFWRLLTWYLSRLLTSQLRIVTSEELGMLQDTGQVKMIQQTTVIF